MLDLVTWSPAINAIEVPGATQIDGTVDTINPPTKIEAGASDYSATPTLAEINARSGWNQVVALLNRRVARYNTLFGTSLSTASYFTAGDKITRSAMSTLQTRINSLRTSEGFSSYTFPTLPSVGEKIPGSVLAHHRKALRLEGICTLGEGSSRFRLRTDNPYGTPTGTSIITTSGARRIGKDASSAPAVTRIRALWVFKLPDWSPSLAAGNITSVKHTLTAGVLDATEAFTLKCYLSNGGESNPPVSADFDSAADNDVGSYTPVLTGQQPICTLSSLTRFLAAQGGYLHVLTCTDVELAGSGATANGNYNCTLDSLKIDFG